MVDGTKKLSMSLLLSLPNLYGERVGKCVFTAIIPDGYSALWSGIGRP